MKFLNRKEEVIQIELTQYGKYLLSRGVFNPVCYAFFDDDIIYDSQYMSTGSATALELSTEASKRIRESIRPAVQTNFSGVETVFNEMTKVSNTYDPILDKVVQIELSQEEKLDIVAKPPATVDNNYAMGMPMGTSEYNSDKNPAWNLQFIRGEISGSVSDYTGSAGLLKIPQLTVEVFYETEFKELVSENNQVANIKDNVTVFEDGTYVEVSKDYILIDFKEHNSLFENENFEIEVYEIVEEPAGINSNKLTERINPLYFVNGKKVTNDVYYSKDMRKKIDIDPTNVEYYFDVRVDDEINDDVGIRNSPITDIYKKTPKNNEEPC